MIFATHADADADAACTKSNPSSRRQCAHAAMIPLIFTFFFLWIMSEWCLVTVPSKVRDVFSCCGRQRFETSVDVGYCFLPRFRIRHGEVDGVTFSDVA